MKKILIAYGTNSGGTFFAAQFLADYFKEKGHEIDVIEVKNLKPSQLDPYDLILFGTNTWFYNNAQGQPHIWYFDFEKEFSKHLYPHKKFTIFALGDSSYIEFCHSADYLMRMVKAAEGDLIGEPLRIDGYYRDEKESNLLLERWASQLVF